MSNIDIMRFCAFRYAKGRSSYVPSVVQEELMKVKFDLGHIERNKYIEEILSTPVDMLGMHEDIAMGWVNLCAGLDEYAEYTDEILKKYEDVRSHYAK